MSRRRSAPAAGVPSLRWLGAGVILLAVALVPLELFLARGMAVRLNGLSPPLADLGPVLVGPVGALLGLAIGGVLLAIDPPASAPTERSRSKWVMAAALAGIIMLWYRADPVTVTGLVVLAVVLAPAALTAWGVLRREPTGCRLAAVLLAVGMLGQRDTMVSLPALMGFASGFVLFIELGEGLSRYTNLTGELVREGSPEGLQGLLRRTDGLVRHYLRHVFRRLGVGAMLVAATAAVAVLLPYLLPAPLGPSAEVGSVFMVFLLLLATLAAVTAWVARPRSSPAGLTAVAVAAQPGPVQQFRSLFRRPPPDEQPSS